MLTLYFWHAVRNLWDWRKSRNTRYQRQRFWSLVQLCLLGAGSKGMLWFMLREAQDALGQPLSIDNTLVADYWYNEMVKLIVRCNRRQKKTIVARMGSDFFQQLSLVNQILVTRKLHLGIAYTCKAPYAFEHAEQGYVILCPPFYIQTAVDHLVLESPDLKLTLGTPEIPKVLKPYLVDTRVAHQKHLDQQAEQKAAVAV